MLKSDLTVSEYNPFYQTYIDVLGSISLSEGLKEGKNELLKLLESIPESKLRHAYAEGKWTLAEVLMHIVDAERVFQYRALCFARNDETPLPGFDHNIYVPESYASNKSKKDILEEYVAVRNATIVLFKSFSNEMLMRVGNASNAAMSTRAMGFIICGHEQHHLRIIRERYL